MDILNEQFEDLKTAILSSIENVDQREIAKGIVHYRRLTELLFSLNFPLDYLSTADGSFHELIERQNIVDVTDFRNLGLGRNSGIPRIFLIKRDRTFYEMRTTMEAFENFGDEWDSFKKMKKKTKEIILDALREMFRPTSWIRYHNEGLDDYLHRTLRRMVIDMSEEEG